MNNFVHIKNKLIYFSPNFIYLQKKRYKCKKCTAMRWSLIVMKKHCKVHSEDKILECQICSKVYDDQDHLDKHEDSHVNESGYTCMVKLDNIQICGKTYRLKGSIRYHLKNAHKKQLDMTQRPKRDL